MQKVVQLLLALPAARERREYTTAPIVCGGVTIAELVAERITSSGRVTYEVHRLVTYDPRRR